MVRVRFAPSPTGFVHLGSLRTALYNYLFAKRQKGTFILRIEDTDRSRYVEGAIENLLSALNWAGLVPDEGPEQGGEFGPYFQSKRTHIYKEYAKQLIEQGRAYYAFDTVEEIEDESLIESLAIILKNDIYKYPKLLALCKKTCNKRVQYNCLERHDMLNMY